MSSGARRVDAVEVRRYYDRHTPRFVAYGQGRETGAIHRAVWGPGVHTREQAFRFVDDRIAELIGGLPASPEPHVVDLGCGVGGSLCYLATRVPMRGTGVTLSPVQVRLAAARIRDAGVSDRVTCLEGDFCRDVPAIGRADVAYAIEAFAHAPDPHGFFSTCRRLVRADGLLAVCDDTLRPAESREAMTAIERFQRGWHVNALLSRDELRAVAQTHGFEHRSTEDLTPWLEIRRPRDRVIRLLIRAAARLPAAADWADYLIGGDALQECLVRGWVGYDFTVFRRMA